MNGRDCCGSQFGSRNSSKLLGICMERGGYYFYSYLQHGKCRPYGSIHIHTYVRYNQQ